MLKTDREERIGLLLGCASQDHVGHEGGVEQSFELRLEHSRLTRVAGGEQELGILLTLDQLALQAPALPRAQQVRRVDVAPVDLAQIDLMIRLILAIVGQARAQEAVREPLREEHEHHARVGRRSQPLPSVQRDHLPLRRKRRLLHRRRRRQVPARKCAVGQAQPARVVARQRQSARPQRRRVPELVDHRTADQPPDRLDPTQAEPTNNVRQLPRHHIRQEKIHRRHTVSPVIVPSGPLELS